MSNCQCRKESPLLEKTIGTKTVKIWRDADAESPREWDNLGKILYRKNNRYTLGDEAKEAEELQEIASNPDNICLPVYAMIHGSVSLSTGSFGCPWDSGQCGIIFVSKEKIRAEWKVSRISSKLMKTVRAGLECEIKTYDQYLNGMAIGYTVEDADGNETDSCWGYYGMTEEELLKEAISENELKDES